MAGCGGGDTTDGTGTTAAEASGATTSEEADASSGQDEGEAPVASEADVAGATAEIEKYKEIPPFTPPGPAFDASRASGKTVYNIPISSAIPFIETIDRTAESVAKLAGVNWVQFANQGQPSEWVKGIDQAIAAKADLILLNGPDPQLLQPQLEAAEAAGIPVVEGHLLDPDLDPLPNVDAFLRSPFLQAGRLMADWAISDTQGDAHALVITADEVYISRFIVDAIEAEFAKRCPSCTVDVVNVPIVDWASKIQTETQSAIVGKPELNYVIPIYDGMAQFAVAGIKTAAATDRVKVATFNGTPATLQMIQDEDTVAMDVGESLDWMAWASMDMVFRILTGEPVVENETILRVFDDSNVAETGVPPEENRGYGDAYIDGYREIWGLSE